MKPVVAPQHGPALWISYSHSIDELGDAFDPPKRQQLCFERSFLHSLIRENANLVKCPFFLNIARISSQLPHILLFLVHCFISSSHLNLYLCSASVAQRQSVVLGIREVPGWNSLVPSGFPLRHGNKSALLGGPVRWNAH